jgi:hypothetical protein
LGLLLAHWGVSMHYDRIAYILLRVGIGLVALLMAFQPG